MSTQIYQDSPDGTLYLTDANKNELEATGFDDGDVLIEMDDNDAKTHISLDLNATTVLRDFLSAHIEKVNQPD